MTNTAALMLIAWAIELVFGWPKWLFRRIRHPVVWLGTLISMLERALNRGAWSYRTRYIAGTASSLLAISAAAVAAFGVASFLPQSWWGIAVQAFIASSLIASRSLHAHVAAVAQPLAGNDQQAARLAVSMLVGRDPNHLDNTGIARAGLESLAENASDGVVAPLFWGTVFGLPGLAAYKAINTLDSMIGYRNDRYAAFGGFAARLDDLANLLPARMTGLLIAAASGRSSAFAVMLRDADKHRSPNAGWPEAAMAGGLGIRLSGPRVYGARVDNEPWLNEGACDPDAPDMVAGLTLYRRAMAVAAVLLLLAAWSLSL